MLHGDLELTGRDLHPGVRLQHAPAGVRAGTAGGLTQLVDDLLHQPLDVRPYELAVGPVIAPDTRHPGSVSAVIASPPPSRSYSDFVCVVIVIWLPLLITS